MLRDHRACALLGLIQHTLDLLIHLLGGMLRNLSSLNQLPAQEDLLVGLTDRHEPDDVGHTETRHHLSGHGGRPLDVVPSSRRDLVGPEDQLLGDTSAEQHTQLSLEPLLGIRVPIFLWQTCREPERLAPRYDRNFVQWVEPRQPQGDNGVPCFVIRGQLPLRIGQNQAPPLGTEHDLVLRRLEMIHGDFVTVVPSREKSCLITDVREIRAAQPRRALGHYLQIHVPSERQLLCVHAENPFPAPHVGEIHNHLTIEAARSQKGGVEHIRPVGGRE